MPSGRIPSLRIQSRRIKNLTRAMTPAQPPTSATEPELLSIDALRANARRAGGSKMMLGVILGIVVTALGAALGTATIHLPDGAALPMVACILLMLVQGGYLVHRGHRQRRVSQGEVCTATVVEAVGQGSGKPGEQSLTYTLSVDVETPDGLGVLATSTNVFGGDAARAAVGRRVQVIWSIEYLADAYVSLKES
jgi:hypothetical protein